MKYAIGLLAIAALPLSNCTQKSPPKSDVKYYGADSQKARLTFKGSVEFKASAEDTESVKREKASAEIQKQVKHLFGALKDHQGNGSDGVIDFTKNQGVPENRHTISNISFVDDPDAASLGRIKVTYDFADGVAFSKGFLAQGKTDLKIRLPIHPSSIFSFGQVPVKSIRDKEWGYWEQLTIDKLPDHAPINLCTDVDYNNEGDFWYFWNPYRAYCPSIVMDQTIVIDAHLQALPSTEKTYPEYDKLVAKGDVTITYILGPDEDIDNAEDQGRLAFENAAKLFVSGKDAAGIADLPAGTKAYLENLKPENDIRFIITEQDQYSKTLIAEHKGVIYYLLMYLINPKSETASFRGQVRNALHSSDILIYDGHSGLGGNLALDRFYSKTEDMVNKNAYQIYFFNACSTFAYYNANYFDAKKSANDPNGTKNLDIVTTSIGAKYKVAASTDFILAHSLVNGSRPTWQKIMDDVYNVDPAASALTQVNGDEDNVQTVP